MAQKIVIDLHNGTKLVAEEGCDSSFPSEIYIGIMDESEVFWQDLAVVRGKLNDNGSEIEYADDEFEVLVYANKDDEDYTNKFSVELRDDEEQLSLPPPNRYQDKKRW